MKDHVFVVFFIVTLSISFVGYSASSQTALATTVAHTYGRPTIFDLYPRYYYCLIFPDICNLQFSEDQMPDDQIIDGIPIPGPVCLSCPNLDISNLNLNESLILTQLGGSVIVTKVPTESNIESRCGCSTKYNKCNR